MLQHAAYLLGYVVFVGHFQEEFLPTKRLEAISQADVRAGLERSGGANVVYRRMP